MTPNNLKLKDFVGWGAPPQPYSIGPAISPKIAVPSNVIPLTPMPVIDPVTDPVGSLNESIENLSYDLTAKLLRDKLDMIKLVNSGGTTGNDQLDFAIKGIINAVRNETVKQNSTYMWLVAGILGVVLFGKKLLNLIK